MRSDTWRPFGIPGQTCCGWKSRGKASRWGAGSQTTRERASVLESVPLLDLEPARRITGGIVGLLARWAPEAQPYPEDRPALEFAQKLRRREPREILYLPELAIEPAWPPLPLVEDDSNH